MAQAPDQGGAPQRIRRAILIELAQTTPKFDRQAFPDWTLDRVTQPNQAREQLFHNGYPVGLARLSGLAPNELEQLATIIRHAESTLWIALVDQTDRQCPRLQQLIGSAFYDYFTLPLDSTLGYLRATMGHALDISHLRHKVNPLPRINSNTEFIGNSEAIRQVTRGIEKVACTDAPVMIRGATGTGKELVARSIHKRSDRKEKPFIAVNCGALPDTLVHAELFGYEKGAFTGAYQRRIGRIEAAAGGTIFLDEIGDLPLDLQVYLLRFLEQRTIERLGGSESLRVDARIIAATHVDLERAVEQGTFREDLYYRLNVLKIRMPTLTERYDDIEPLACHFLHSCAAEHKVAEKPLSPLAIKAMQQHNWPGNIRELINRIRCALIMGENPAITTADLGLEDQPPRTKPLTLEETRNEAEKQAVWQSLLFAGHNITQTAKILGISRVTLYRLIEKYGLKREE